MSSLLFTCHRQTSTSVIKASIWRTFSVARRAASAFPRFKQWTQNYAARGKRARLLVPKQTTSVAVNIHDDKRESRGHRIIAAPPPRAPNRALRTPQSDYYSVRSLQSCVLISLVVLRLDGNNGEFNLFLCLKPQAGECWVYKKTNQP